MRIELVTLFVAGIFISACAHRVPAQTIFRYSKSGATQEQFMPDRYECMKDAQQRVSGAAVNQYGGAANSETVVSCDVWVVCLGARGYQVDANGTLGPPPGMVARCRK